MFKATLVSREYHKYLCLLLLLILALIASSPLSLDSWFDSGDHVLHLIRCNDVCYEMSTGDYYPRWLSQSSYGKGSPTLNFYAPAFYLLVGYLNVFGIPIITAIVVICVLSFFFSGWGMFCWTRKYYGASGALIAASIYIFAPYHFADIYLRGGIPEFMALSILPFLFHGIDVSLLPSRGLQGTVYTALATAGIILTHNLSAMMIFPSAFFYFIWCSVYSKPSLKNLLIACSGPILGAGLAAFYWLPVLLETKYLLFLDKIISGPFHYAINFLDPSTFFTSGAFKIYNYHPLYALTAVCAVIGIAALTRYKGHGRGFGLITGVLCLGSIFMTLSISSPLYGHISAFQYVQFPWRFLGPATLFLSAFCGTVFLFKPFSASKHTTQVICGSVILLCIVLSGDLRKVERQLPYFPSHPVAFSRTAYPIFFEWSESDYMPVYSRLYKREFVDYPMVVTDNGLAPLTTCEKRGSRLSCSFASTSKTELIAPWFYFPGWKAECDGAPVPTRPGRFGLVAVTVPEGQHHVKIYFGTTWPRIAGWITGGASLAVLICIIFFRHVTSKPSRLVGAIGGAAMTGRPGWDS